MHFEEFSFGLIRIDGVSYEHDVVIDRGKVRKRKRKASKRFRDLLATHHCASRRRYLGNARGW